MSTSILARRGWVALLGAVALVAAGCRQDMHDQPRYEPLEASAFFADGMSSRHPVEGTVARGELRENVLFETGKDEAGQLATVLPVAVDRQLLTRGRERYGVFCSPCHGGSGEGDGMVVRRGFKAPPSFHIARLREQPPGYYFDVMTVGFGQMPSYAAQIRPEDRWAIAAYVQVLQLSHEARLADLSAEDRAAIDALGGPVGGPAPPPENLTSPEHEPMEH